MLVDVANTSAVNAKTTNRVTATSVEARRSRLAATLKWPRTGAVTTTPFIAFPGHAGRL